MPQIVPSILENTKDKFLDTMSRELKLPGVERLQVDFGDGEFVPNNILPVTEIDPLNPAFQWEAHLMCRQPMEFLDYQICGFKTIIVHYEAYRLPTQLKIALQQIKAQGMEPGICLKIETPVEVLQEFAQDVRHFQLMSINPGFQGTPFLEESYGRIAKLRKICPNAIIEVDGGVNETNIKKVASAGADLLIAGSVITKVPDMAAAWGKLNMEMNRN